MLQTPIYPWGKPVRPQRPKRLQKYSRPLPVHPHLKAVFDQDNPFSIFSFLWQLVSECLFPPSTHPRKLNQGFYDAATRSVHITDEKTVRVLWEQGFFGKGSLSRSEPEWLEGEKRRLGLLGSSQSQTSADVTRKRREDRREAKMERARLEAEAVKEQLRNEKGNSLAEADSLDVDRARDHITLKSSSTFTDQEMLNHLNPNNVHVPNPAEEEREVLQRLQSHSHVKAETGLGASGGPIRDQAKTNQEHLQLSTVEAFFLSYGLGALEVLNLTKNEKFSFIELFTLFCRESDSPPTLAFEPDNPFIISYVVYHHFRSLGWVVRPGMKFAVDYLLYHRGPVFAHAEFAILILPSYSHSCWASDELHRKKREMSQRREWWWLLGANRVQTQVRKTLVLVYVDIPPPSVEPAEDSDITDLLQQYRVREFVVKRWSPNRNRD